MAQSLDPHRYDKKLKLALNNLERQVGRKNAAFLRSFAGYLLSEGISQGRVLKYLMHLVSVARMLGKDFDKANVKDIRNVVLEIEEKRLYGLDQARLQTGDKALLQVVEGDRRPA